MNRNQLRGALSTVGAVSILDLNESTIGEKRGLSRARAHLLPLL